MSGHPRGGASVSLTGLQRRMAAFFREHPQAVETTRGMSAWLGEEAEPILEALGGLLERRWLTADETSAVTGYALTRDAQVLAQMDQAMRGE